MVNVEWKKTKKLMAAVFNVLEFDVNSRKTKPYDVLPYFRNSWASKYNKAEKDEIKKTRSKELFKEYIRTEAHYQFWARCEYEILVASWPFGSYRLTQDMKDFLKNNPDLDLDNLSKNIEFENIITRDMEKIDIYEQIMMNIDIIVDILYKEFNLDKV